jgi:hypothetical protein
MRLVAKHDVEAPAAFVFAQLTDFEAWERAAMRRGADVQRSARPAQPGAGTSWQARFDYREKPRNLLLRLDSLVAPTLMTLTAESAPANAVVQVDVADLAARRTRIEARVEIRPKTIAARIFLQTLRLARARLDREFDKRMAQLSTEIEERYRRSQRSG